MIWQVMLDSGHTLSHGFGDREKARAYLRQHNARAREGRRAVARGDELVSLRLAIALVSFKPRIAVLPVSMQSKGGRARAAKLSPERRSEIAKAAALKRWGKS